jgi:NAD-dependent deacetylase
MNNGIAQAAEILKNSGMNVALTGAGISTPSGIPDFRSPGSGLWEKFDPVEVATIDAFIHNPSKFYELMTPLGEMLRKAKPNPAHIALAQMEKQGKLNTVITQNIDNLHQRAGSDNVLELHGNGERAHCYKCGRKYEVDEMSARIEDGVPRCECGGLIKPDVVLFGEPLPFEALSRAEHDSKQCGAMIIVGSSLTVAPASLLPQLALQYNAKIIVLNLQRTYIDTRADVVLREKVETALPAILELMN